MIPNLMIDLDGTLTDPKAVIIGCLQYALEKMGHEVPEVNSLLWLVGPSLRISFETLLNEI